MNSPSRAAPPADGFALVAAVLALALLSLMAIGLIDFARGDQAIVAAEATHARLRAAADAGLYYAIRQLSLAEHERRWSIDGRPHVLRFDRADLLVAVEDERGKVPLNTIDDDEARRLFSLAGVDGQELNVALDSFLDWRDADDRSRPNGAEAAYYRPLGRRPRNGPLRSTDELLGIRGITPALVSRLRSVVTVFGGTDQGFDQRYAAPFALKVMGEPTVTVIERERELAGERPPLPLDNADFLVARPLAIHVIAREGAEDRYERTTVIEFTGSADQPVLIRASE